MSVPIVVSLGQAVAPGSPDTGLTFREVVASLPVDPASLFGLALLLGFFGVVLWYGTRPGKPEGLPPLLPPSAGQRVQRTDLPGVSAPGRPRPGPRGKRGR